jgi:hypothetical protein
VYCSIDKIDLAARHGDQPIAVQTDHRARTEIEAEPELSALFAMARIVNARNQLADEGHPQAAVHYVVATEPPPALRDALIAAGGVLERADRNLALEELGPPSPALVGELADRCFGALARRAAARVGSRDLAIALRMLEDQTFAAPPDRDDEPRYWTRVLELAALAGELLRAKYPGHWVLTDRAMVPFGFQLATDSGGSAVMLPTNRAQRVIEDGPDESLFKLLVAAEETMRRPTDTSTARLMPSLRHRGDVELDEVIWRPLLADQAPADLPIIVCGVDGESTFGMIRKEALDKPADQALAEALENLADEDCDQELIELAGTPVAVISGSFYAAEKLLDRAVMRELHDELAAEVLLAATPCRGLLLVMPAIHEPAAIARFAALARMRYEESGGRSISPAVVLVTDGKVAGYVRGPDEREPSDTDTIRADTAPGVPKKPGLFRRIFGRK